MMHCMEIHPQLRVQIREEKQNHKKTLKGTFRKASLLSFLGNEAFMFSILTERQKI